MDKDDPIVRLAFSLWHEDRLREYDKSEPSPLGFWPSVFTDFLGLSKKIKKPYIEKAKAIFRENNINTIIKK